MGEAHLGTVSREFDLAVSTGCTPCLLLRNDKTLIAASPFRLVFSPSLLAFELVLWRSDYFAGRIVEAVESLLWV